jgi:organic hydroperoxide reductase OsmC/OhrA
MKGQHNYAPLVRWTGNKGVGISDYKSYERSHIISADGKPDIAGSSDPTFRGAKSKYNPEDMMVAALSSCHMLWYLHLCAEARVVATDYFDNATGVMVEKNNGGGRFTEVTLNPTAIVKEESMIEKARLLHKKANELCFIANSVNFSVKHNPIVSAQN